MSLWCEVINSGTSKDPGLMQLLRCLFFVEAKLNFQIVAKHTPGVENGLADALSSLSILFFPSPGKQQASIHTRQSSQRSAVPPPGLDLRELDEVVRFYFQAALAPSTQRAYRSGKNRYLKFCEKAATTPLPVSEQSLC